MALPVGRTAKAFVGVAVFILAWLVTHPAAADTEGSAVEVVATGDPVATSAVEALVRELLNRLPVVIRWADAPHIDPHEVLADRTADPGVLARVWVDLSRSTEARLFVANGAGDHFLVRVVPADGHLEVEREAVAQIIGFAVEAILAGGEIGVTREAAAKQILAEPIRVESPVPMPPLASVSRPVRAGISGGLGAFVGLRALGPGSAVGLEPGLWAAVSRTGTGAVQPALVLELQYEAPLDLPGNAVAVRLEGAGGRLHGGILARLSSRVSILATLGLGADAIHAQPYAPASSPFTVGAPFWLGAAIATARLGMEVVVATPVSLFASGGCDLDMSGVSFPVTNNGSAEPNVVPWRVWPVARIGVSVSLDGGHRRLP